MDSHQPPHMSMIVMSTKQSTDLPSELVIQLKNSLHQSINIATEKTDYEVHEHLTPRSCMDGFGVQKIFGSTKF